MSKLSKGANIKNSSLFVMDYVSESRVRCQCSVCGKGANDDYVSMVYRESDLLKGGVSCRFCKEVERAKEAGIYIERASYMTLLESSSYISILSASAGKRCVIVEEDELGNKDFVNQYPLGVRHGELVSIAYMTTVKRKDEYGIHYTIPTHIVLKCENCGYITFIETKKLDKVVHVCPLCFNLKKQMEIKNKKREDNKVQKSIEKSQAKEFQYMKTEFAKLSTNKVMQKNVKSLESKNVGYKVVDIVKEGGATTYHLVCESCGTVTTCMRSNTRLGNCEFCKSKEDNKDYTRVGYLYKNYVGTIYNGVRITEQSGLTCTIECIRCGKTREGIDINGVLDRRYFCDCVGSKLEMWCPQCCYLLPSISYGDIYAGKFPKCSNCGNVVDESFVLLEARGRDYTNSLHSKLSLANKSISEKAMKKIRVGNRFGSDTLLVEKTAVYKGNDGKSYYRCFCTIHNVGLTLSEDEIKGYSCQGCDDARQDVIANPDAASIRLE